jgi:hypothetical protein
MSTTYQSHEAINDALCFFEEIQRNSNYTALGVFGLPFNLTTT